MANDAELELTGAAVTWTFDALSTVTVPHVEVTSGTVVFDGTANLPNVRLGGGLLQLNNPAGHALASYTQTAGTLTGSGPVTVNGPMVWNGGTITDTSAGNVAFNVNGGLAAGTTTRTLDGRTMNLNSSTKWSFGTWSMRNGAVLNNNAGHTFDIQGDHFIDDSTGFNSAFNNFGTVLKSAGAGSATIEPDFTLENGTITVATGQLALGQAGSFQNGHLDIQDGLRGTGIINANVRNASVIRTGLSPGSITIDGDYEQTSSGTLDIELAGTAPGEYDRLVVTGTATLAGTLNASPINGFAPSAGDRFAIMTFGTRSGDFGIKNLPPGFESVLDDAAGRYILQVPAPNQAPTVVLAAANPLSVSEGSMQTYAFTISDPDGDPITGVTVSCGANAIQVGPTAFDDTSGSFVCSFPDGPATSTISAAAADSSGSTGPEHTQQVSIANDDDTLDAGILGTPNGNGNVFATRGQLLVFERRLS